MLFDLKGFIKKGLLDAVGKLADYQVVLIAAYWFDKHVLSEADMTDIEAAIKHAVIADEYDYQNEMPTGVTYYDYRYFYDSGKTPYDTSLG